MSFELVAIDQRFSASKHSLRTDFFRFDPKSTSPCPLRQRRGVLIVAWDPALETGALRLMREGLTVTWDPALETGTLRRLGGVSIIGVKIAISRLQRTEFLAAFTRAASTIIPAPFAVKSRPFGAEGSILTPMGVLIAAWGLAMQIGPSPASERVLNVTWGPTHAT